MFYIQVSYNLDIILLLFYYIHNGKLPTVHSLDSVLHFQIFLYDCTIVSPYPLLFFGGDIIFNKVNFFRSHHYIIFVKFLLLIRNLFSTWALLPVNNDWYVELDPIDFTDLNQINFRIMVRTASLLMVGLSSERRSALPS